MKKLLVCLLTLTALTPPFSLHAQSSPARWENAHNYTRSDGEFAAAIVVDGVSGEVLYEYKADTLWPAASLTKLMGAMVFVGRQPRWGRIVSISKKDEVGGGRLRVSSGATMSLKDLLYSSITASANNAATAMARVSGLGYAGFVKAMNVKAGAMGLKKTVFVDPSGIDAKNMTTAREMAKLAAAAFNIEAIRRPATTSYYRFSVRNTGQKKELKNTNALLVDKEYDELYVTGGKTGFLYESQYNLAVRLKPPGVKGIQRSLMVVVFGSPSRDASFRSASGLANWAWKSYTWGAK